NPAANVRMTVEPKRVSGENGVHVFITVGSLIPVKGHDIVIQAFSSIPDSKAAKLHILGEGAERGRLQALIDDAGLSARVQLVGYTEDVATWYASADTFVLGSYSEGFGNVIVEALEHGLQVVSTATPGAVEILGGGKYGTLVPV